jgi:hypothetical protein
MGQSYSDNMNEIQIEAILSHLTKPEFFQSFHKASSLSSRVPVASVPDVEADVDVEADAQADVEADAHADAPDADAHADAPDAPDADAQADIDVEADADADAQAEAQAFERENTRLKMKEYGDLSRLGPFDHDTSNLATPAAAGGTRRKRQYTQKTKRYRTLSKRFKKNKTRRLHRSYIRN